MKTCTKCKAEKDLREYHKNSNYKDGLANRCKLCVAEYDEQRYVQNHTKAIMLTKIWKSNNPKRVRENNKKYCEANTDKAKAYAKKYNEVNREKLKAYKKKWLKKNPDKAREAHTRRRVRKLNAFVAPVDRQEIFARDGGRCHICKRKVDPDGWHLDHIIPLSKNGTHEPRNVAVSHPRCNMQKHTSLVAQMRLIN